VSRQEALRQIANYRISRERSTAEIFSDAESKGSGEINITGPFAVSGGRQRQTTGRPWVSDSSGAVHRYQDAGVPAELIAGRDRGEEEVHGLTAMVGHAILVGNLMHLSLYP